MKQVEQQVTLLAHSQLSAEFKEQVKEQVNAYSITSGQAVSMTAIRTCYSPKLPTDIVADEAKKYFGEKAKDGGAGTEADRLFRLITGSGHTSTLEHVSFTFAIEGVTRALLAQLTRHRVGFSFSVQSQRYVRFGTNDRSGGASYVVPDKVLEKDADEIFKYAMTKAQEMYDALRSAGVPAEDARAVLPNGIACNMVMTANLTALLSFYGKRRKGNGAQHEITVLAENIREAVVAVEPWTDEYFEKAGK
jgi:thymidylate synthase (FAD)